MFSTLFPYVAFRFLLLPISCGFGALIAFKWNAKFSLDIWKASAVAAIAGTVFYVVAILVFDAIREVACLAISGDPSLMELCVRFGFGFT